MVCAVCDILWIYVLMEVTRLVFLWENIGSFRITFSSFMLISHGGLLFDTSAIMYVNALWLILAFPSAAPEGATGLVEGREMDIRCDQLRGTPRQSMRHGFYGYRHQRSTMSLFTEFGNRRNIARIIGMEVLTHWYLLVLLIVMIWSMWKLVPAILDAVRRNHSGTTTSVTRCDSDSGWHFSSSAFAAVPSHR